MTENQIIDFHTHPYLSAEDFYCFYPEAFSPSAGQCMEDVKRAGIAHICGSVILREKYAGGFDYIRDCNDRAFELKKILGDFYTPGFHIHPDFVRESLNEIELRVKQGFGLIGELVPYMHGWSDYSQRNLGELLDAAEHYHLPVSFHTVSSENAEMDKMIEAHPNVTFIAAHPGDKEQFLTHLERIKKHENYCLDLSGTGIFRYGLIAHGVREVGSERLIFGTDFPICNPGMYVRAVLGEPISEADMENILFKNARRVLAPKNDMGFEKFLKSVSELGEFPNDVLETIEEARRNEVPTTAEN